MPFATADRWSNHADNAISFTKKLISNISYRVRTAQFALFVQLLQPSIQADILDVGTTPNETLKDSNLFEQLCPHPSRLTIASVEDCTALVSQYRLKKFIKLQPGKRLPFKDKQFDIVVSWATLEHVGSYEQQAFFLNELSRVGKKLFVTTPYKYALYEPHTETFLLHWLPNQLYRHWLSWRGSSFWAQEENWNALGLNHVQAMLPAGCQARLYFTFGVLASHIVVYK